MNYLALKDAVSILKMSKIIKLSRSIASERDLTYINWNILKLNVMRHGSPPKLESKGIRA